MIEVVKIWNLLLSGLVGVVNIEGFSGQLDKYMRKMVIKIT